MFHYNYELISNGKTLSGKIQADSYTNAVKLLKADSEITIIQVKRSSLIKHYFNQYYVQLLTYLPPPKLNHNDCLFFTRELQVYLESGLSLNT